MSRTLAIDLPVLFQGNLYHANVLLVHDTLNMIKGIKHVQVMINSSDLNLLYANPDYSFWEPVMKFLSEVNAIVYDTGDKKEGLTYAPNIAAGLDQTLADAVYLQLCVVHTRDNDGKVVFVGFIPRFTDSFQLETTRDKKTKKHQTVILSTGVELETWVKSYRPTLSKLKHTATGRQSSMGAVSPFTSLYTKGEAYAEQLLQQAYQESQDGVDFPHYLYTWDAEAGTFIEFRHENHDGDSHHNYHGRNMQENEYGTVPPYIRQKYHR